MIQTSFWWYLGAFVLALGILIVVHEFGHYLVARRVGVKVLRFSVGFGKPLLVRRWGPDETEWVVAAFPLGGYVKMLDEREGEVRPEELHRAFNRLPVGRRALVVAAGPAANLLLAVVLYWALFMHGVQEMRPILAAPPAETIAAHAGVENGDSVRNVSGTSVTTMQDLRWQVMRQIVDRQPVVLEIMSPRGEIHFRQLRTADFDPDALDADFMKVLGLAPFRPRLKAIVGAISPGSAAADADLRIGDEILAIDGVTVGTWSDFAKMVRESPDRQLRILVRRDAREFEIAVVARAVDEGGQRVGRIGIGVRDDPEARARMMVEVKFGALDGLAKAIGQTWETSVFSLRMIGRMLVGELSWKNISGPVTIADYAGQSARLGLDHYIKFLALISISLGVLNLLPIPILDGGHLLYYLIEVIKGGPLSERAMEIGQQIGMGVLAILMAFAFYNDITRLISG